MTDNELPANERSIAIGGLMRCCTQTIRDSETYTVPGDTMDCPHCSSTMLVRPDGVWEWVWERTGH